MSSKSISVRTYLKKYLFSFVSGFSIAFFIQCYRSDQTEARCFQRIANCILHKQASYNEDSVIVDALHTTYYLLANRSLTFDRNAVLDGDGYDGSLTADLLTAEGACGSYADVLSQLLQTLGFQTRIAQMKVRDRFGGHILVEAYSKNGWVVLDASFDLYFVRKTGGLASFKDVSTDWPYYRSQAPAGYNMDYRYEDVRYTNWNKIPVVMPFVRQVLVIFIGEEKVDAISVRPLLLRRFRVYYYLMAIFVVCCILHCAYRCARNVAPAAWYSGVFNVK
jgi:hypothetical protein